MKMDRVLVIVVVVAMMVVCRVCSAPSEDHHHHGSPIQQCSGQNIERLKELVKLSAPCSKTRCKLRRGTNVTITIHFKADHEMEKLTTEVSAILNEMQVPFVGVTGSSACDSITRADSGASAPCPLKPDVEYVYSKTFPIEPFYPTLSVKVHWALNDGKKDIICFEAPVVIK